MNEDRNQNPRERLRNILSSNDEEASLQPESGPRSQSQAQPESQPQATTASPLAKLPHLKRAAEPSSTADAKKDAPKPEATAAQPAASKEPQGKQPKQPTPTQEKSPPAVQKTPRREKFLRALWTLASLISMIFNVVVIVVVVVAFWAYRDIKLPEGVGVSTLNKLLGGLYSNFEKLDRATIKTVIPVDAQIPLDISVPVQTTTRDVTRRHAALRQSEFQPAGADLDSGSPGCAGKYSYEGYRIARTLRRPARCCPAFVLHGRPQRLQSGWTVDLSVRLTCSVPSGVS